uniref:Innexin n=1 Tax=Phlebotomus papatasi TaxID=29031 RepID=A0A1B0DHS2_PHLPP
MNYMVDSLSTHNTYATGYFICEILNFINVVGNIFFVDKFLGGAFLTYGTDVVKFSNMNQESRYDPMVEVFPRVTKCTFHKYGSSGSIQKHDALCVLALNILNEKIYIFLWFWFIILSVLSGMAIIYSAVIVMMPTTHFLLLHLLGQNINVASFGDILHLLCNQLVESPDVTPSAPSTLEMAPPALEMDPINNPLLKNLQMEKV